ncbi:MAG: hypothetical protein WC044_09090 [Crocinitomicaceae bacterium]
MTPEIENIIRNSNFKDLSDQQKLALQDWASSEEEFETLQQILVTADSMDADVAPSPTLRTSLTETFSAQYGVASTLNSNQRKSNKTIVLWLKVAGAVAAVFMLFFLVFPLLAPNKTVEYTAEQKPMETKKELEKSADSNEVKQNNEQDEPSTSVAPIMQEAPQLARLESNPTRAMRDANLDISTADRGFAMASEAHSDRLFFSDMPDKNRQVVQENPELLAILYTSF